MMTAFTQRIITSRAFFVFGFTDLEKALGLSLGGSKMAPGFSTWSQDGAHSGPRANVVVKTTSVIPCVRIVPSKNKMALSFGMTATRLDRIKNGGLCQCYNKFERNVQNNFGWYLPLK
jgi:hypothetical protein